MTVRMYTLVLDTGLNYLINRKGNTRKICLDDNSGLIAKLESDWSDIRKIEFKYIQPEKPTQDAFVEHFNGSYRRVGFDNYIF